MVDFILSLIGTILYPLFSIIFLFIDILQMLFFSFAGIGDIGFGTTNIGSTNGGNVNDTGLIFYLLNTDLIRNMLVSIAMLALFLIIVFTVMAFLKNSYSPKPKNWQEIIGSAFKGLANFIIVPVVCLLGVWLGNILLKAVNGATSAGGSTSMSRKLFIACAYNANDCRNGVWENSDDAYEAALNIFNDYTTGAVKVDGLDTNFNPPEKNQDMDYYANYIDSLYGYGDPLQGIGIWNWIEVGKGYALFGINYLVLIIGGVFMMYVMITLTYGMIKRMFKLLILFMISPAMCAMYPIDDGKACKGVTDEFKKEVLSAFGAVAAVNLFFALIPLIEKIDILGGASIKGWNVSGLLNTIVQLVLLCSGLFVVKEIVSFISGLIGGADAYSAGQSLRQTTKEGMKKTAVSAAQKTTAFAIGAVNKGRSIAKGISTIKDLNYMKKANKTGSNFTTIAEARKARLEEKRDSKINKMKGATKTKNGKQDFEYKGIDTEQALLNGANEWWSGLSKDEQQQLRGNQRKTTSEDWLRWQMEAEYKKNNNGKLDGFDFDKAKAEAGNKLQREHDDEQYERYTHGEKKVKPEGVGTALWGGVKAVAGGFVSGGTNKEIYEAIRNPILADKQQRQKQEKTAKDGELGEKKWLGEVSITGFTPTSLSQMNEGLKKQTVKAINGDVELKSDARGFGGIVDGKYNEQRHLAAQQVSDIGEQIKNLANMEGDSFKSMAESLLDKLQNIDVKGNDALKGVVDAMMKQLGEALNKGNGKGLDKSVAQLDALNSSLKSFGDKLMNLLKTQMDKLVSLAKKQADIDAAKG